MRIRSLAIAALCCLEAAALEPSEYIPEIHGTFRGRYEYAVNDGEGRFQVRNFRASLSGQIAEPIGYYAQVDICDRGKFKVLDAYGWLKPSPQTRITVGQSRIPFSVDASRGPHQIYFANRSFIGRDIGNYRGVGARMCWTPRSYPLLIEAGAFNTAAMGNHDVWEKSMSFGAKARYTLYNITAEVGFESLSPDSIRFNSVDCSLSWSHGGWLVEGEYLRKHYTGKSFDTTHAFNIMANYSMPVKAGIFNRLSFQGRFDGATANSNGKRNEEGRLTATDPSRRRATIGSTISYIHKKVRADIRLNYERYFYRSGVTAPEKDRDRITAELVIRF